MRVGIWVALGVVLGLRLLFPPAPVEPRNQRMGGVDAGEERPRGHRPTPVHTPVAPVPPDLWRLEIEVAPADVAVLRAYRWNGWRGQTPERPDVLATVREGGLVYSNVALHLKGAAGSFRPFDDKPALTLTFNRHVEGQSFRGYRKLSLNNSVQDPTYLSEIVCRELFEAAGVPVPKADHATVVLNGRDLGLYVLTEGWGKPFLRRYFEEVGGNLYDGGFVSDIHRGLDTNSGDHREDHAALDRLVEAASEPDPERRGERLARALDVDRFLSLVAMEVLTCHWDGYAMNRNNYRVFHDVTHDRMVFMPHGLDQMFGVFRSSPDSTIHPPMVGLVAQAILSTPGMRERYFERLTALRSTVFLEDKLTNRVHALARRLRPTLAAYGPEVAEQHDAEVAFLCQRIVERARSVSAQLAAPQGPIDFDAEGVAVLTDWSPRGATRRGGSVRFDAGAFAGREALGIVAGARGGVGVWRTRVRLAAGVYRLEANVHTHEVEGEGGVCLRAGFSRDAAYYSSDGGWSPLAYRFQIAQDLVEVELSCELRTARGEAWFERDSLRLVRE